MPISAPYAGAVSRILHSEGFSADQITVWSETKNGTKVVIVEVSTPDISRAVIRALHRRGYRVSVNPEKFLRVTGKLD